MKYNKKMDVNIFFSGEKDIKINCKNDIDLRNVRDAINYLLGDDCYDKIDLIIYRAEDPSYKDFTIIEYTK